MRAQARTASSCMRHAEGLHAHLLCLVLSHVACQARVCAYYQNALTACMWFNILMVSPP